MPRPPAAQVFRNETDVAFSAFAAQALSQALRIARATALEAAIAYERGPEQPARLIGFA